MRTPRRSRRSSARAVNPTTFFSQPESDRLWAPWRNVYLSLPKAARRGCVFCDAKASRKDRESLVIARYRYSFVLLNRYPYNPGHLMLAPYRHVGSCARLRAEEAAELFTGLQQMTALLEQRLHPIGFNVGVNIGRVAGAGVLGHLHVHVVPRWVGDANFMPTVAKTRVMSDSLDALYARLRAD